MLKITTDDFSNTLLTPGLQLLQSQPLEPQQFNVLLSGLSEARPSFPELANVKDEFTGIQGEVHDSRESLSERFTNAEI